MKAISGSKRKLVMFLLVASMIFQISSVNGKTQYSYLIDTVNMPLINKYGLSVSVTFEYELSELIDEDMFLYLFVVFDDIANNNEYDTMQFDAAMMFYSDSDALSNSVFYKLDDPLLHSYWSEGIGDVHYIVYGNTVELSLHEFIALSTNEPKMKLFAFISDADSDTVIGDFPMILSEYLGEFKLPDNESEDTSTITGTDTSTITGTDTSTETDTDIDTGTDDNTADFEFTPGFGLIPLLITASLGIVFKKMRNKK